MRLENNFMFYALFPFDDHMRGPMRVLKILLIITLITGSAAHAQEAKPARVVVAKITRETVAQNQSFPGTLYYERISHVSSEVPGLVADIRVKAGDRVNRGDSMVRLDTQILGKEIIFQQNQVDQAGLYIRHSRKNFLRMDSLYQNDGVREKDLDDADFVLQEAMLKELSARTLLEKLLIRKEKSIILAPFDGIVLEKNVDSGDWVLQGKALVSIGSINDLFIQVPVAETLLKYIVTGQQVPVVITAYDRHMAGTVDTPSPIADPKTKNVSIKIRIPMIEGAVQNMSAAVFLPTGRQERLAMIPRDALVQSQGRDHVYTIRDGKAVLLPVTIRTRLNDKIGADDAHFTEGMVVVVDGNERLRPGQPVAADGET
jgi:RND family efflux transporter MFP subunit